MSNLDNLVKAEVARNGKYPKLLRIKFGKALFVYASLPLFSAWAYAIAVPLMMPISPTMWAKMKLRDFETWRRLR